jgi:hypothetical protein
MQRRQHDQEKEQKLYGVFEKMQDESYYSFCDISIVTGLMTMRHKLSSPYGFLVLFNWSKIELGLR